MGYPMGHPMGYYWASKELWNISCTLRFSGILFCVVIIERPFGGWHRCPRFGLERFDGRSRARAAVSNRCPCFSLQVPCCSPWSGTLKKGTQKKPREVCYFGTSLWLPLSTLCRLFHFSRVGDQWRVHVFGVILDLGRVSRGGGMCLG